MSEGDGSVVFVRWTARVVAALGLGFVFVPLIFGWVGDLQRETVELFVTGVGVPLLTFAGFLAVYLGFLSQREQNELQKRQLETQRDQIKAQQANFEKDRFESTFFQLLRTHNQIVKDISLPEREYPFDSGDLSEKAQRQLFDESPEVFLRRGRSCFDVFYKKFEELFEETAEERKWGDIESSEEGKVGWVYNNWFADRKSELNHYFSHLAQLISFIHRSDVEDKEFYIDLVIAQMSVPELKLFFYHVNLMKDNTEHRHLRDAYEVLGEYTFFEQIDRRSLAHDQHYQLNREALGME